MANDTSPQRTPTTASTLPEGLSPDSIDTLPVLAALLARLQTLSPSNNGTAGSPPAATPSAVASGTGAITIKDIPAATDGLKHKIQKARVQTTQLPDMQRTIADQEAEIRELEERIRSQRAVLEGLRDAGLNAKRERVERDGDAMET